MPDVSRSDSQRSDASSRPRVSFNRDVHVKRIGNGHAAPRVDATPGSGRLALRRERPADVAEEAKKVLQQAESIVCVAASPNRFNSLPSRRKKHVSPERKRPRIGAAVERFGSLDRQRGTKKKPILTLKTTVKDQELRKPLSPIIEVPGQNHESGTNKVPKAKAKTQARDKSDPDTPKPKENHSAPPPRKTDPHDAAKLDTPAASLSVPEVPKRRPRGTAVDTMVRRLSEARPNRGPPCSPGQHNLLPFSYTAPTPSSPTTPPPADQQVIYAEVVCKQTVHSSLAQLKDQRDMLRGRADGMEEYRMRNRDELAVDGERERRIEPVLVPRNDLSTRRDRLESRIADRSRAYRDDARKFPSSPRLDADARKFTSNPRLDRREFLNSQINYDNKVDLFGRSVDNIDKYAGGNDKLTDSGIDMNFKTVESQQTRSSYQRQSYASQPTLTNITKVDVNGHVQPGSEDDEEDEEEDTCYFYNQQQNVDQIRAKRAALAAGNVPVVIRQFGGDKGVDAPPRRRREFEDGALSHTRRLELEDEECSRKRATDLEETRRFLSEERRSESEQRRNAYRRPEKLTKKKPGTIERMRALFSTKKKPQQQQQQQKQPEVDQLTSRYTEYRGAGNTELHVPPRAPSRSRHIQQTEVRSRERLPTPSPSPSRATTPRNIPQQQGSWFKSLDRLTSRKKVKPKPNGIISENEEVKSYKSSSNNNNVERGHNKNLRFFGDTDAESVRSHRPLKPLASLPETTTSSTTTTRYVPLRDTTNGNRRYKGNKLRRHHRSVVGDIPGRVPSRSSRLARSREELSSTTGSNLTPQTRTVSRSISVLAPWKPRHYREPMEVHYENGKPPKVPTNYKTSSSTLNRIKNKENKASYNSLSRSTKERSYNKSTDSLRQSNGDVSGKRYINASQGELNRGKGYRNGATTLKKSKGDGTKRTELARSVSMPKDSKVKSGWFRLRKK